MTFSSSNTYQHCPVELCDDRNVLYVCSVQSGSHQPTCLCWHLRCAEWDRGTEFYLHLSLNSSLCLVATRLDRAASRWINNILRYKPYRWWPLVILMTQFCLCGNYDWKNFLKRPFFLSRTAPSNWMSTSSCPHGAARLLTVEQKSLRKIFRPRP